MGRAEARLARYDRAPLDSNSREPFMNLSVTEIRLLSSGAVSVEVSAAASIERPTTTTGVDAVRFQVLIPKNEVQNDLDALKALALKAVKGFKIS
jgi:hypothetical protein